MFEKVSHLAINESMERDNKNCVSCKEEKEDAPSD